MGRGDMGIAQGQMKQLVPFLLAALLCTSAVADEIDGRVVKVSDGDTITVLDRDKRQIVAREVYSRHIWDTFKSIHCVAKLQKTASEICRSRRLP